MKSTFFSFLANIFLLIIIGIALIPTTEVVAIEVGGISDTTYTPLADIPGVTDASTTNQDIGPYISGAYKWAISLSIALAVVVFTFQAFRYLLSESTVTNKSQAKAGMQNVIIGLLLILTAYMILETINPKLVTFDLNILSPGTFVPPDTSGLPPCSANTSAPNTNEVFVRKATPCKASGTSIGSTVSYMRPVSGTNDISVCRQEITNTAQYPTANKESYSCVQGTQKIYIVTSQVIPRTGMGDDIQFTISPNTYASFSECRSAMPPLTQEQIDSQMWQRYCTASIEHIKTGSQDLDDIIDCSDNSLGAPKSPGLYSIETVVCEDGDISENETGLGFLYTRHPGPYEQCVANYPGCEEWGMVSCGIFGGQCLQKIR